MQRHRFVIILAVLASSVATACQRQSPSDRMVGIWQFSGMDATMDYVFKPDHTFEIWAPSMDVEQSKGPWLHMGDGTWQVKSDELIMETQRPPPLDPEATPYPKQLDKLKVRRFGTEKIEFERGGPLIRATSRRGI